MKKIEAIQYVADRDYRGRGSSISTWQGALGISLVASFKTKNQPGLCGAKAWDWIVIHIHDEIVLETNIATVDEICELMAAAPDWPDGLLLSVDGYACDFYMKD